MWYSHNLFFLQLVDRGKRQPSHINDWCINDVAFPLPIRSSVTAIRGSRGVASNQDRDANIELGYRESCLGGS